MLLTTDSSDESIVLEVGSAFVRIGVSGECQPRFVIPWTTTPRQPHSKENHVKIKINQTEYKFMPLFQLPLNDKQIQSIEERIPALIHLIFTQ